MTVSEDEMVNQLHLDGLTKSEVFVDRQEIAFELTADGQPIAFNATYDTIAELSQTLERMLVELRTTVEADPDAASALADEIRKDPLEDAAIAKLAAPAGIPHTIAFERERDAALTEQMKADCIEQLATALEQLGFQTRA